MGEDRSLAMLFARYRDYLFAIAERRLDPRDHLDVTASDIVQETFLDAQRSYKRFTGRAPEDERHWLRRILLNNVTDAIRRRRGRAAVPPRMILAAKSGVLASLVDPRPTPSRSASERELADAMEAALSRLPADHQEAIRLRHHEDLSFAEIGRRLHRTENAARKLWARAIKQLQDEFEGRNGPS